MHGAVNAAFLEALVVAFGRARPGCAHDDPSKYTIPTGNVIHCACGEAFRVKCMHTRVERVLERVFRCVDCREWRGMGAA